MESERKIGEELRTKNRELTSKTRLVEWIKNSFVLGPITNFLFVLVAMLKVNTMKHLEDLFKERDSWKNKCF